MLTHYDVLGVPPGADQVAIKAAYRARIKRAHPDAGGSTREAMAVLRAYEALANEGERTRYDEAVAEPPAWRGLRLVLAVALTAGYLAQAFH